MSALYDTIGLNYANLRRPDKRIALQIDSVLGMAQSVVNVGAGSGNYEPVNRDITAVEPSSEMIRQRSHTIKSSIEGVAEALPFDDMSFDAGLAVLTVHHWSDLTKGLQEMRRVVRGQIVILTYNPSHKGIWLDQYFPGLQVLDKGQMPELDTFQSVLGEVQTHVVPIPHDCSDGFLYAYWRRPGAYLDPAVRAAMSSFHKLPDAEDGLAALRDDLETGAWVEKHGAVLRRDSLDCGYRLLVAP